MASIVSRARGAISPLMQRTKPIAKQALGAAVRSRTNGNVLTPSVWGLERDDAGRLLVQGIALDDLVERHGGPLHVVDGTAVRANAARFLQAGPDGKPLVEAYYSYKSNPVPGILQLLDRLGVGAEVTSHYELWLALQLGVAPEHIIFNGPGKSEEGLRLAVERGIQIININQLEEVERIAAVARELGRRPRVGIRVSTSGTWQGQFATHASHALDVFRAARATGVLDVVGLHQHIGGHIGSVERLAAPVDEVLDFVELVEEDGFELEILNLGGGLAVPTTYNFTQMDHKNNVHFGKPLPVPSVTEGLTIEDFVNVTHQHVAARYERRNRPMPRLMLEPGRGMTANTQMLVTRVLTERSTPDRDFLFLDAGVNVLPGFVSEYHHIFANTDPAGATDHEYRLVGPTCAPWDTLLHSWYGPELHTGDTLTVMDTGAYFVPMATTFSFAEPGVLLVDEGREVMLRRGERFEDIIALDKGVDGQDLV
ncbi:diaminopimelate decarboxylase family protein [Luteococcus sp. Sow4_B9]|uniref:diaminopimelate decarboxylase family protein n=1 Tax=Luteococcus sp. Sow4_B9 TaxID=3438792 RepID=UPI003F95803B